MVIMRTKRQKLNIIIQSSIICLAYSVIIPCTGDNNVIFILVINVASNNCLVLLIGLTNEKPPVEQY